MNIKVCGITQFKQLQQLEALNIDYAGLIFYKDSPRYIGNKITGKQIKDADFDIKKVGVFVDPVIRNYWMPLMNTDWTLCSCMVMKRRKCVKSERRSGSDKSVSYSR
jgi:phosphoribosylanthranilate isomerase